MAYGKGKKRLSIAVSSELDDRLQRLADAYGVTKSALCTMYLAQTAAASEKALNSVQGITEKLVLDMTKDCQEDAAD